MIDPVDLRFFCSLQKVLARIEAVDATCRSAVDRAVASGAPEDLRIARDHVHALPVELRDRIMREAHASMASDLSAIWDLMAGSSGTGRPN